MKFEDLLREHRIPVAPTGHHHTRTGWLQLDCPFCSPKSGRWRLGYNVQGRYVNCWTCGPHRLVETLVELIGVNPTQAFKLLGGIDFEKLRTTPQRSKLVLPPGVGPLQSPHKRYLQGRRFDIPYVVRVWGVQGIGLSSRLSWRVFIPIRLRDETVSWTTRAVSDNVPKRYHSASPSEESLPHRELLYGEEYARHSIIIHEGPLDVWRTGPGAVATMGTAFTRAQVARMSKYPIRAVCFDSEPDAQKRARDLCRQLEVFDGQTFNVVLKAKDAGSASDSEIKQLRGRFLDDASLPW